MGILQRLGGLGCGCWLCLILLWLLDLRGCSAGRCGRGLSGSVFLPFILVIRCCHLFIIFLSFGFGLLFLGLAFRLY